VPHDAGLEGLEAVLINGGGLKGGGGRPEHTGKWRFGLGGQIRVGKKGKSPIASTKSLARGGRGL